MSTELLSLPADRVTVRHVDGDMIEVAIDHQGSVIMRLAFPVALLKATGSKLVEERWPWLAPIIQRS